MHDREPDRSSGAAAVDQLAVGARDQLCHGLVTFELGEPDADRGLATVGQRGGDGAEALASFAERHVRHHAEELVAAEADDQVIRAQVSSDGK